MHRLLITATCAFVTSLAVGAESPAVSADAIRAHVEFLSDDLLEGRAAGARGYELAARYVASQMRHAGLEPAGDSGGWLQWLDLIEAARVLPAAELVVRRAGVPDDRLAPLADFIPGYYFGATASEVTAPAVYLGFGIHAPELSHDDFAGIDLTGRIGVILSGAPARFPNSQRAHYSARAKTEGLVARGAVGIITVETPEEELRVPWQRKVQMSWAPRMRLVDDAGQPIDAYPEIRGSASVSVAAAGRLFAGGPTSAQELFAAASEGRFHSFTMPVELGLSLKNALSRAKSANVVGLLRGADPALAGEYVVLTAHLDHIGRGPPVDGDAIYNGALDNASGVAIMLETARALAASAVRPRRSILVVAVTAEERGLLGSDHFARQPTVPRAALVANLNTDMPDALYPVSGMTLFGADHSTLGAQARAALAAEGVVEVPDATPQEVYFVRSDQYSFVRQGIPAIMVDTGALTSAAGVDAAAVTRRFMLEHYHMPSDSTALPIDWPSLARLARVNARLTLAVANDAARPRWLPGDFFGEKFGRAQSAGSAAD